LITTAGDAVSDSLWHRVVQIVTNNADLREYAAYTILQAVKEPTCSEVTVSIAGHILGEFGHVIVESPGCSPLEQFMALHSKFGLFSAATRAILLSTYLKFVNLFPEIKGEIIRVFESYQYVLDVELQQRACEYLAIIKLNSETLLPTVCEEMPPFIERESALLGLLTKKLHDTEDVRTWTIGGADAQHVLKEKRTNEEKDNAKPLDETELYKSTARKNRSPEPAPAHPEAAESLLPTQAAIKKYYEALLCSPNGILYEDAALQIGIKTEYQNNLGRIAIFFGNKTAFPLLEFAPRLTAAADIQIEIVQEMPTTLPSGTQLHIMVSVEAVNIPAQPPSLTLSYSTPDRKKASLALQLPVPLTKFMASCTLDSASFMSRWKQIGGPPKEAQTICSPGSGIQVERMRKALTGLGMTNLEGIDPNPDNFVLAGIFSARNIGKVGCLARIECNKEIQVSLAASHQACRITVRSTNEGVSAGLCTTILTALLGI
ncbi:hypothetical protein HDU91_002258, partial [Kappamyces sp. JEL0680]